MLPKAYRMSKKSNFERVFTCGKSYASRHVVIYIFKGLYFKFGFIASKKIGNAVKRNRAKRLMREALRLNMGKIKTECQMIFIARGYINNASLREVENSMINIWKKAGILCEECS